MRLHRRFFLHCVTNVFYDCVQSLNIESQISLSKWPKKGCFLVSLYNIHDNSYGEYDYQNQMKGQVGVQTLRGASQRRRILKIFENYYFFS